MSTDSRQLRLFLVIGRGRQRGRCFLIRFVRGGLLADLDLGDWRRRANELPFFEDFEHLVALFLVLFGG